MKRHSGPSDTAINRCKTTIVVFLAIAVVVIFYLLWSPPTSTRHGAPVPVAMTNVVDNTPAAIFDSVLRSDNALKDSYATTGLLMTMPEGPKTNKTGRYVSMCQRNFDGRRVGNQLFNLAAMLHVALLTGRRVAMVRHHPDGWLDRWFHVSLTRVKSIAPELCPCVTVQERTALAYSRDILTLSKRVDITGKSLLVCGFFQSWKYTARVESALRYHLRLLPNVSAVVHKYLDQIRPSTWKDMHFRRIGIHVRAGDIMSCGAWRTGYTIPQRPYFEQAMAWFVNQQRRQQQGQPVRVQFVVASESQDWVKVAINLSSIAYQLSRTLSDVVVDVKHSEGHDAGFDLALLSACDGVIISTGTYSWWSAWLANKTTIYYSNWPRAGSPLAKGFARGDYFPPNWIPVDGPAFPRCQELRHGLVEHK